jgi:hypothetical protein
LTGCPLLKVDKVYFIIFASDGIFFQYVVIFNEIWSPYGVRSVLKPDERAHRVNPSPNILNTGPRGLAAESSLLFMSRERDLE